MVGSSIARVTHAGSTHAGPEIGVASTKAFTAQVTVLTLMALTIGQRKGTIAGSRFHRLLNELDAIPAKVEKVLQGEARSSTSPTSTRRPPTPCTSAAGTVSPVALEGALKLKEISYIHAEGYPPRR